MSPLAVDVSVCHTKNSLFNHDIRDHIVTPRASTEWSLG
jgi:hypothetical protein